MTDCAKPETAAEVITARPGKSKQKAPNKQVAGATRRFSLRRSSHFFLHAAATYIPKPGLRKLPNDGLSRASLSPLLRCDCGKSAVGTLTMDAAQRSWEIENCVNLVDPYRDALYTYDPAASQALMSAKPWSRDPHYFKSIRISAVALLKMVMHARSGGSLEVMGLMQGYVSANTFVVTDAFRLPVEGTETRVNAQDEANEYMVSYLQACRDSGRMENAIGWYHSHPGYGCWLSGIDVSTQDTQQTYNDPFVAVVIDPDRTISAGKVEIGAFRTYPKDYQPSRAEHDDDGYQSIPLHKVEDFGAHASQYYSLEVSHFKSTLDTKILSLLWNKYWVATISQSPLFTNRDYITKQMADISEKIKKATRAVESNAQRENTLVTNDQQLEKVVKAGKRIVGEELNGLMAAEIKRELFQGVGPQTAGKTSYV
uniref:COP9 signalosome complex subunit 5 n=1 Tax=Coccidioides posadasii RMSCC 3488 TaxID=454284 RepID=A0A0J6FSV8_COCPO|nr:COP9 signalosome complex subunit 5 [Coccidioides posadasii RMSCC 3488]